MIHHLPAAVTPAVVDDERVLFTVDASTLRAAVNAVTLAASTDQARPLLTGVLVDTCADGVRLVACDSYRLHVVTITTERVAIGEPFAPVNIPAGDLVRIVKGTPRVRRGDTEPAVRFVLETGGRSVRIDTITPDGASTAQVRLLEGDYPQWEQLFPPDRDGFPLEESEPVAWNPAYLADICAAAKAIGADWVKLARLVDNRKPTLFTAHGVDTGCDLLALVMPIRLP
jgi:DNA polymerase III sliding clamp (beta) subunit (PCNA family)